MPVGSRQDNGQEAPRVTATATRKRPPHRYDPVLIDQRTRLARRARTIERQLRAEIERLGRIVTVHDDLMVGQAATLATQVEIARGMASRGQHVDNEALTRTANALARALNALGLKPSVVEPAVPKPIPTLAATFERVGKMR